MPLPLASSISCTVTFAMPTSLPLKIPSALLSWKIWSPILPVAATPSAPSVTVPVTAVEPLLVTLVVAITAPVVGLICVIVVPPRT